MPRIKKSQIKTGMYVLLKDEEKSRKKRLKSLHKCLYGKIYKLKNKNNWSLIRQDLPKENNAKFVEYDYWADKTPEEKQRELKIYKRLQKPLWIKVHSVRDGLRRSKYYTFYAKDVLDIAVDYKEVMSKGGRRR